MIRQPVWTNRQVQELKMLYETGVSTLTIAQTLDRSLSAIRTRAALNHFRRPKRSGTSEVMALKDHAVRLGLNGSSLPDNPTALRVVSHLAETDISTKPDLDKVCAVGESARNKAIKTLRSIGLIAVDDFRSPAEVILTRKAFKTRPEPTLADHDQVNTGALPSVSRLRSELDAWLPLVCRNQLSIDSYRDFIIRQLANAQSGDIAAGAFFSIFFAPKQK